MTYRQVMIGLRGESFADIARRLGSVNGAAIPPDATDQQAIELIGDAVTAAAAVQASLSQEYALAAAAYSAIAESLVDPAHPDTATGLAATTDGQPFAVDNGDGTVTIYLNDGGSAVEQRTLATTAALGSDTGSQLVGFKVAATARTETVEEAMIRQGVYVDSFKLPGDGLNDYGPAIQRAIDAQAVLAAANNMPAVVKFRDGVIYQKAQEIELKDNVHLYCDGTARVMNTVDGQCGFKNATGTRLKTPVTGVHAMCASGVTGTKGWDLTDVGDCTLQRVGCQATGATAGFAIGIDLYSTTGGGGFRALIIDPFVRTRETGSNFGIKLHGSGSGMGYGNGHRIIGGTIRADGGGTNIFIYGDGNMVLGAMMEGSSAYGVDVYSDAICRNNIIGPGNRFEDVTNTGIRFGVLATFNVAMLNLYTSGIPTAVSDLSGENFVQEVSGTFSRARMGRGHFEAWKPLDTSQGVFLARMAAGAFAFDARATADTFPKWCAKPSGRMQWGSGSAATDVGLERSTGNFLRFYSDSTTGGFGLNSTRGGHSTYIGGDFNSPKLMCGAGTPESVVQAPVGSFYSRTDGGAATSLYVKESGTGNTGWAAK